MSDGDGESGSDVSVRAARDDETEAIRRLFDAAVLTVPVDLSDRVGGGDALVALRGTERRAGADRDVIGALVLDGSHVDAVAVRRSRRADGVGTALVAAAGDRVDGPLTATFRSQVRPFYESLGFEVEERDRRLFGRLAGGAVDEGDDTIG
ncbi:GNAT family N-acetyltransferase [Halobaculum halobium]|uniref:GNAT family N-acetyltransferase n=1 Tax=Halobaculum halobium TaxID=3032281 RepID=A0ABD5TIJ2_9EURY|nr:GNAT family N-acetyltransferase [Halobaculum sp. SYNS20]